MYSSTKEDTKSRPNTHDPKYVLMFEKLNREKRANVHKNDNNNVM